MCGLTGGWTLHRFDALREALPAMTDAIAHRGPDDAGHWLDADAGIALGHRRLAIVDLSPHGHQPMVSASGRWVLVYNGEIYNHQALRRELDAAGKAPAWRGHSDTETLLAAVEAWGLVAALQRGIGMFALALWDRRRRELWLARDRLGEKPLYYGLQGGVLLFASELKALRPAPGFGADIDRDSIASLLRHNVIPSPHSIYRGIGKLMPGTVLRVREGDLRRGALADPVAYWSVRDAAVDGRADPFTGTDTDAIDALETLLGDAVAQQMVADVPLGAFLSGGIDSSTIVALMQARSTRPVRTFTIGFDDAQRNEAEYAKAVAAHLHTDHTELYVTAADALALVPQLPQLYDEPFADSSQIPTVLVSRMTRRHVTVSLSGDGGDESFFGYARYLSHFARRRHLGRLPTGMRRMMAGGVQALPARGWDALLRASAPLLPRDFATRATGERIHAFARMMALPGGLYEGQMTHWLAAESVVIGAVCRPTIYSDAPTALAAIGGADRMMCTDLLGYLPDDILVKVDRAAMAVGLETRVPLLDHRVVEFALRLPLAFKYRERQGKWLLRNVLYRHVPKALIERPKMGFGVPLAAWLRGPLRDWAHELLRPERLAAEGYFDPAPIQRKWRDHQAGIGDWQEHLWDVLMVQAWLEVHTRMPARPYRVETPAAVAHAMP